MYGSLVGTGIHDTLYRFYTNNIIALNTQIRLSCTLDTSEQMCPKHIDSRFLFIAKLSD